MTSYLTMESRKPVLMAIRASRHLVGWTARVLIVAFLTVLYNPSVYAIVHSDVNATSSIRKQAGLGDDIESQLEALQQRIAYLNQAVGTLTTDRSISPLGLKDSIINAMSDDPVRSARIELKHHHDALLDHWHDHKNEVGQIVDRLHERGLQDAARNLNSRILEADEKFETLGKKLDAVWTADSVMTLKRAAYAALKYLADASPERPAHIFNAGEMPFGVTSDATRSPYTTTLSLHSYLNLEYDPALDHAQAPVNATADTAATPDVQITPEIRALALELGYDSVAIYNWVYNNIYYIPSFGSIQGSAQTLANRQGNAFDIASLLIALLRASNIPARYVYGTVVLPADQITNWVGGVRDIQGGRVVMAQGGIPTSAISYGGRFERLRMEHVWVEAYGNFNQQGVARWNGLDAAFKQYQYTNGMNLLSATGFDANEFRTLIESGSTSNTSEGWVANVDSTRIQNRLNQYQSAVQTFLDNQHPDATLSEVIGGQTIIPRTENAIPAQLPYLESIRTRSFARLPDKLRHYFRVELARFNNTLLTFQRSLPELAGKQLALSFRPATPADEAIVTGLFQNIEAIEDLPTELHAGLFNVVGEVTVNGEVVASSPAVGFGDLLSTDKGFVDPRFGYRKTTSPITAGDYQAIGLDLQGITVKQVQDLQSQLEAVQSRLTGTQFNSLTKHEVVGSILQGGMLMYFGMNDAINKIMARMNNLVHYRMPSFGTFSTYSQVSTVFGSSSNVKLGAVAMDVDWLMSNNEGKSNCWQDWVAFNQMSGQIASAFEHIVPEQIFSTADNRVEAVSTMKALAVANAEGQRIYTIDRNNIGYTLPLVTAHALVKQDIQRAVAAGNTAIIHERPIDHAGYQGSGYILLDPDTGTGAYKITGGGNGSYVGFILGIAIVLAIFFGAMLSVAATSAAVLLWGSWFAVALGAALGDLLRAPLLGNEVNLKCFVLGLITGLGAILAFTKWSPRWANIMAWVVGIVTGHFALPGALECVTTRGRDDG
jgi:transglutaminase-like putative cysteine protease